MIESEVKLINELKRQTKQMKTAQRKRLLKRFVSLAHRSKYHRFFAVKSKYVCNYKPTFGFSFDNGLQDTLEIRILLIWWQVGVYLGSQG